MKIIPIILIILTVFPFVSALNKPQLQKYVNDFANVLDYDCENKINSIAEKIESDSTAEIAVVTMSSLCNESGCDDLEKYANELFRENGIGKKEKNNGAMVLVFIQDRRYRIEVGYGLEGNIPDIVTHQVAEKYMVPEFKAGNYCDGLYYTVYNLGEYIKNPEEKVQTDYDKTPEKLSYLGFYIFAIIIAFSIIQIVLNKSWEGLIFVMPFALFIGTFLWSESKGNKTVLFTVLLILLVAIIIIIKGLKQKNKRSGFYHIFSGGSNNGSGGGSFGGGGSGGGGSSGRW